MAEATVLAILEQMTAITIDKAIEAWSLVQALRLELEDAEEKEYMDKRVKLWLDKFRYVSYDMEDVLDEWETAVQQLQTDPSGSASLSCIFLKIQPPANSSVALNILLRFAWMQTVLNFKVSLHRETLAAIVASLEIIHRGIWNFFRLENEHLNNFGKFRAFKSVPLPFNYEDDEDRDV
ncbi:hypothetical protein PVK06_012717 [Gossypium arboreum]|uniref:EXS domain-containing protein n=1 Tax=Gossypium arboreum TaxID=29729 RepID=A0ABR0QD05_GOSAR|nr:hypothetical protein PVK06_012717 [Gossypium arboreum]